MRDQLHYKMEAGEDFHLPPSLESPSTIQAVKTDRVP